MNEKWRVITLLLYLILVLLVLFPAPIHAGSYHRTQIGPGEIRVEALAFHPLLPATLYAGTRDGVSKTTDGGAHWTIANSGLPSFQLQALAIHPASGTVHVGMTGGGIHTLSSTQTGFLPMVQGTKPDQVTPRASREEDAHATR